MGKNAQYYADRRQAREAAYKYLNNPFPEDTRKARFYEKEKVHKRIMDSYFDDMEEIYGSIGIKKRIIDNIPNTFTPKRNKKEMQHT